MVINSCSRWVSILKRGCFRRRRCMPISISSRPVPIIKLQCPLLCLLLFLLLVGLLDGLLIFLSRGLIINSLDRLVSMLVRLLKNMLKLLRETDLNYDLFLLFHIILIIVTLYWFIFLWIKIIRKCILMMNKLCMIK